MKAITITHLVFVKVVEYNYGSIQKENKNLKIETYLVETDELNDGMSSKISNKKTLDEKIFKNTVNRIVNTIANDLIVHRKMSFTKVLYHPYACFAFYCFQ